MIDTALPVLSGWENFYVIVGSSAAALIGLQFVVIALIKDTRTRTNSGTISAFGTPTVVHLGGALLVSALMSAPWTAWYELSFALGFCGLVGLGYGVTVIIQARRQSGYTPVFEDWLWHSILPWLAYASITAAALCFHASPRGSSFAIAAAALGLLLVAIHNAWDTVTYIVLHSLDGRGEPPDDSPPAEGVDPTMAWRLPPASSSGNSQHERFQMGDDHSSDRTAESTSRCNAASADSARESGEPGGGAGRRDEVGPTGVYPMSAGVPKGKHPELRTPAAWGQGQRGAAGYEDTGGSELVMRDGQLLGGSSSGPNGEPTIDIHGGDVPESPPSHGTGEQSSARADPARRKDGERD